MRLLLLLLLAFAIATTNALIQDIECEGLHKACCEGEDLPGEQRNPGDIGDGAKTGCTDFGTNKKECAKRKNMACCAAIHGDIGTQCKDVPDDQVTCPEPALAYPKHKRWSLPLKRALIQKRGDWCDQRNAAQQFQNLTPPKPEFNNGGFPPVINGVGGALNLIHELSKSDDKETKLNPVINDTPIDLAPADFATDFAPDFALPAFPANGRFDYTSDPYFQQDF